MKPSLKSRVGVCVLNPNEELVPQNRGLKAEISALRLQVYFWFSEFLKVELEEKCCIRILWYYKLFKM